MKSGALRVERLIINSKIFFMLATDFACISLTAAFSAGMSLRKTTNYVPSLIEKLKGNLAAIQYQLSSKFLETLATSARIFLEE